MVYHHTQTTVPDADRRAFLKALGVTGVAATGGITLSEVHEEVAVETTEELATIGETIAADLAGEVDTGMLATQQQAIAAAAAELPAALERGFPEAGPREEFAAVTAAGRPVYTHLTEIDFFESTTEHLPEFTPEHLESAIKTVVGSEALAGPLAEIGFEGTEGIDLLATVIGNAQRLGDYHWVATDEIPRGQIEFGEWIPPMTQGAAGGTLLWLADLDQHLWQKRRLLTDEILETAVWHGQSMTAGFYLMSEGIRTLGTADAALSEAERGALLTTSFAVQAISQGLLPEDVYWVTDEMRADRRTTLETITADADTFIGGD